MTDGLRVQIRDALSAITEMERYTDSIEGALPPEQVSEFNQTLSELDTELVSELQKENARGWLAMFNMRKFSGDATLAEFWERTKSGPVN